MIQKTDPIKAYFIKCSIINAVYILLLIPMFTFLHYIIALIMGILLYILVKVLIRKIEINNIESILFRDLDPERFKKVIFSNKYFLPSIANIIDAAFFTGDYQTIVNIGTRKLKEFSNWNKYEYSFILARVYFLLGDLDKLKTVCNIFDAYTQNQANRNRFQKQYSMNMRYYRYYLDGNFKDCLAMCKMSEAVRNPKAFNFKLATLNNDFNFAVAYYKSGEAETAKKYFEKIISTAPQINLAQISYKYLDAIKNSDEKILENPEVLPDADYQIYSSSSSSIRSRIRRLIRMEKEKIQIKERYMIRKTDPIKAYFIKYKITFAVYMLLMISMFMFGFLNRNGANALIILILSLLLYKPVKLLIRRFARNEFESILYRDLDPERFKKVIFSNNHIIPSISYRINAAICTGDYQTAVNICTKKLKECSDKYKYSYWGILANIYFELGDLDKLKTACNTFDECIQNQAKRNKIQKQYSVMMRFYRYYMDGNFKDCLTMCKMSEALRNPKAFGFNLATVYNDFNFAVVYYKSGEKEIAKQYFEKIISTAPQMYLAQISYKYLDAIKNGDEKILENPEVLPDADYQIYSSNSLRIRSRIRRHRIIGWILIVIAFVIALALLVIPKVYDAIQDNKYKKEWEQRLNTALSSEYEDYKVIEHCTLKKNGSDVDVICVVESNNGIDLLACVTYDHGITTSVIKYQTNIEKGESYCTKSVISDYYIGFRIYDNKKDIPQNTYNTTKVSENQWLSVDYIEKVPR